MTHTVVKLDADQQRAASVLIGEAINAVLRLLASRRKLARVGQLKETAYFQAIALGGLYRRTLELYEPEVQAEIESHAATLAGLMARPGEVTP